MMDLARLPLLLFWFSVLTLVVALVCFSLGRAAKSGLPYVLALFAACAVLSSVWVWVTVGQQGEITRSVGWIWPKTEVSALVLQLRVSLGNAWLGVLVGAVFFALSLTFKSLEEEVRSERLVGAAVLSLSGAFWVAYADSLWSGLLGFVVCSAAGVLTFSTSWDSASDSLLSMREARDSFWSALLIALGGAVLVAPGSAQEFGAQTQGAVILVLGALIGLRAGFWSGWVRSLQASPGVFAWRLFLGSLMPGFAVLLMVSRASAVLQTTDVLFYFQMAAAVAATGAAVTALFSKEFGPASAAYLLSWICWSGVLVAHHSLAPGLGAVVLSQALPLGLASLLIHQVFGSRTQSQSETALKRGALARKAVVVVFVAMQGVPAFANARLWMRLLSTGETQTGLVVAATVSWLMLGLAGLALVKRFRDGLRAVTAPWPMVVLPLALPLFSLTLLWDGSLLGGVFGPGTGAELDHVLDAPLGVIGPSFLLPLGDLPFVLGVSTFSASWLLLLFVYWLMQRGGIDRWAGLRENSPRWTVFVTEGFGAERAAAWFLERTAAVSTKAVEAMDTRWWAQLAPSLVHTVVAFPSKVFSRWDRLLRDALESGSTRWTDVPSQLAQLTQSGDLRWYVFFGIAGTVLLLLNTILS